MKTIHLILALTSIAVISCKSNGDGDSSVEKSQEEFKQTYRIALGSCNRQNKPQDYWSVIEKDSADIFIWGGDNIYADTPDMEEMKAKYDLQKSNEFYQSFTESLPDGVLGVWDDHDYGKNDAGKEWEYKDEAKALYMDFLAMDSTHEMASREGTYYAKTIQAGGKSIKFYMLDTRYFRDGLLEAEDSARRYQPHTASDSTLLGNAQWKWLAKEFKTSQADFNIIMSSIQFLSSEHGFETWGNFPHEVEKMEKLLKQHAPKRPIILSGDRHISEFSQKDIEGLDQPLTDFTSSGLTHSYSSFDKEPNVYRVEEVVSETSYGIVDLDLKTNSAILNIKSTENGNTLQSVSLNF